MRMKAICKDEVLKPLTKLDLRGDTSERIMDVIRGL